MRIGLVGRTSAAPSGGCDDVSPERYTRCEQGGLHKYGITSTLVCSMLLRGYRIAVTHGIAPQRRGQRLALDALSGE